MVWTDQQVEALKQLWKDGLSASQMARKFGVTRNAIIGKAHRLGLTGRAKSCPAPRARKPVLAKVIAIRPRLALAPLPILEPIPEPAAPVEIIPFGQRCTLHDLTDSKCRWPVGDPSLVAFFFCGGPPIDGLPYCDYHSRVAYQPVPARRRQAPRY